MRTWLIGCSLLALVTGSTTTLAWGSEIRLNDFFTFPDGVTYTHGPHPRFIEGHGVGGQFLGMGSIALDFRNRPDPEGGHDDGSLLLVGAIPELGLEEEQPLGAWRIVDVQDLGDIIRLILEGDAPVEPALGFDRLDRFVWDAVLSTAVPLPATGLLLGLGVVILTARRWLRRS